MLELVVGCACKGGKLIYRIATGSEAPIEVSEDDIPDRFKCQITGKVMVHPVMCSHECYFEKEIALQSIGISKNYCPVHGGDLPTEEHLIDCDWLEAEIKAFWTDLANPYIQSLEMENEDSGDRAANI